MKKVCSVLFVLSVLGVQHLFAAPEDEVQGVFERFVAAQNAHDVRAVGALLLDAPHFLWITRGAPIWGHEAALKRFEALYQGTWRLEPDMSALRVMMLGDTTAQVYVPIVFTIGAPGQAAQTTRFLMNQVLVKTSGGWRVSSILPIPVEFPILRTSVHHISTTDAREKGATLCAANSSYAEFSFSLYS